MKQTKKQRKLQIAFTSGEDTCYNFEQEKMCEHVRTSNFGTKWWCSIFEQNKQLVEDAPFGKLLRKEICKKSEI